MARNEEKAQSMLYRFREAQRHELGLSSGRRPAFTKDVKSIAEAERWRAQLTRDIAKKIQRIQERKCLTMLKLVTVQYSTTFSCP